MRITDEASSTLHRIQEVRRRGTGGMDLDFAAGDDADAPAGETLRFDAVELDALRVLGPAE